MKQIIAFKEEMKNLKLFLLTQDVGHKISSIYKSWSHNSNLESSLTSNILALIDFCGLKLVEIILVRCASVADLDLIMFFVSRRGL